MSACAAGEIVATVMIVASASICWRIAFSPTTSPACAELALVGLYLGYGRWSSKNERATVKKLPQIFSAFSLRRGWDVPRAAREGRPRLGTEFTTSFDTRTMPSKKMAQGKAVGSARPTALLF
jgi:hypothetical protein